MGPGPGSAKSQNRWGSHPRVGSSHIAYRDTTMSCPIHRDPFMPIYFRKIYNSLILHVKSSFFLQKMFLKAIVRLFSHL